MCKSRNVSEIGSDLKNFGARKLSFVGPEKIVLRILNSEFCPRKKKMDQSRSLNNSVIKN